MPKRPGPKPQPADVIELRGNRSKLTDEQLAERRASTPAPKPLAPKAPKDLSPVARECWQHHASELEHLGLLTVLDGAAFRLACEAYALAVAALGEMRPKKADGTPDGRKRGFEVLLRDKDHEPRRHPAFIVWKQATDEYRSWCSEFGMTPSARVGLRPGASVGTVADDDEDDDSAFFGT